MTRYRRIDPEISRRKFVNWALGLTAGIGGLSFLTIVGSAKPVNRQTFAKLPPSEGDVLVYAEGPDVGKPVRVAELQPEPIRAYPLGTNPDGEPEIKQGVENTNLLLVSKFAEGSLQPPTNLEAAVEGIVAYSAICMHLGCPVGWRAADEAYLCPCHSGVYAPKRGCLVIGGPPPRPLPQLPLAIEEDRLVVAGTFLTPPYTVTEDEFDEYRELAEEAANI